MDFANNLVVKGFLERSGQEALPLILADGDFKVEALVLNTPQVNITGSGDVNFHRRIAPPQIGVSG